MKSILTKQEIFDQVVSGLVVQIDLSKDMHGVCFYRSPNGLKYAAGFLLPGSEYNPSIEGHPVQSIVYFKNNFANREMLLIRELQRAHDSSDSIIEFLAKAKKLAEEHKLKYNAKEVY